MSRFEINRDHDEKCIIIDSITGDEIASANHDEHGWAGIDLLERTINSINDLLR